VGLIVSTSATDCPARPVAKKMTDASYQLIKWDVKSCSVANASRDAPIVFNLVNVHTKHIDV